MSLSETVFAETQESSSFASKIFHGFDPVFLKSFRPTEIFPVTEESISARVSTCMVAISQEGFEFVERFLPSSGNRPSHRPLTVR